MDDFIARNADPITISDTVALNPVPEKLLVCAAGNIVLRTMNSGADITITGATAGQILPLRAQYVRATGTTATLARLY